MTGAKVSLRVLFLHQGAELYGSDRVLLNLASHLAEQGHRVMVVLPEEGPLAGLLAEAGAEVVIMPVPVLRRKTFRGPGIFRFFGGLLSSRADFDRVASPFDPDVVCTNTATMLTAALWAGRKRRPHLWLVHEFFRGSSFGRLLFASVIHRFSHRVITPSKAVAEHLARGRRALEDKTTVIPNGIVIRDHRDMKGSLREELGLPEEEFLVGVVGRFNWWKGQKEMIPVMEEVLRRRPGVRFIFAGAPYRGDEAILEEFKRGMAEAGLGEHIHLLGEVDDINRVYADLDALVLPSIRPEPFGLVLLEAMAAGLPVAAYRHGGPTEIIQDGVCGLLVPPGDGKALAEAILKLAGDPAFGVSLGRAGRERVDLLYTAGKQGSRFEEELRDLAGEGKKKLKIAVMGTRGIPASYGGFETFAEELSTRLAARGHRLTVYGRSHYVGDAGEEYRGVKLAVLPSLRHKYLETVSHAFLSTLHGLFRGYDAVLMCNAANSIFCFIPRLSGARVLINVDGLEWQRKKWNFLGKTWYLLGERLAVLFSNQVVSDARVIQEYYLKRYRSESLYIPYGAPMEKEEGEETLERLGLKRDGYFLYVSRLEPENNAHVVIEAYSRVKTDLPLVVVGDAPYSREYIAGLKQSADPRVIFTGFIFGRGYRQLQSGCYAYIHATEVGGTHPALIEGMGMAEAVVVNDTPENREVAGRGALLYGRNDPGALAEVLESLLAEPEQRKTLREEALAVVGERYDWERITEAYEKAFHDMIGRG